MTEEFADRFADKMAKKKATDLHQWLNINVVATIYRFRKVECDVVCTLIYRDYRYCPQ